MAGNILEAVQGFATPAMIAAATATLGLNEKQASGALGAAVTSIFGAALQKSNDASAMTQIASLASGVMPDAGMFSNIAGMLNGGVPSSPLQILGNRFLGQIFGGNQAGAIAALATASGISGKAASSLMTLAAPMALAAIRSKLGPAPTAASVASLLNQDRNLIAQAMPSSLRAMYGLATVAPAVAASGVASAVQTSAATANPAPAASAPPAAQVAPAVVAATAAAAPIVAAAASTARAAVAHTASGHASAPAAAAAPVAVAEKAAAAVIAAPVMAAPVAKSAAAPEPTSSGLIPTLTIMLGLGLGLMALGLWWKLSGVDGNRLAITAKPATTTAAPTPAAKPAAATTAAKQPAGPTPLVGTPSGSGLKYTLPNNTVIEVGKNGVEQKLIEFITSASPVDKNIWFDFDRLSFETGSSDVTAASRSQIEALSAILKAYPATKVKIGGYTDNQGDAQANLKLSDSRAKRVAEELVKSGVTADRIEAEGYGEQHAVGDNATPEGRAKNRRTALSVRAK